MTMGSFSKSNRGSRVVGVQSVIGSCIVALASASFCAGQQPDGAIVKEVWEAAYLGTVKAGFVHRTVREVPSEAGRSLRTTVELSLTVKNRNEPINLRMETGSDETPAGKVTAVSMRQFLGKNQQLDMQGQVTGDRLHVKVDGGRKLDDKIPWNDTVIGLNGQTEMFRNRKVMPGDRFKFQSYEPVVTSVVGMTVNVKDLEEVESPLTKRRERMLRAEIVPDKISGVQLPKLTVWLDGTLEPVQSQVDMPPLGLLTLVRTTKQVALAPTDSAAGVDIGFGQTLPTNRRIARPYEANTAVFRITITGDDNPATTFARDEGQSVKNATGNSFELHVLARRQPSTNENGQLPNAEYLQSCFFISSANPRIQQYARQAVGSESDPWRKALRIENWVNQNVRVVNKSDAFVTADEVAKTMQGDCTEFSVLAAAMCRAAGIPSRTAIGLVYHISEGRPVFNYHMWLEVYVKGQWLPLDPTLGRASVGAMHLKITDHSWADTQALTPLLPLMRVIGKVGVEVVSVDGK
jgi:hypothetical protein